MTALFVVAERPRAVTVARARATLRGLVIAEGWHPAGPGVACCGRVVGDQDASAAVLAALAGAELIIDASGAADGAIVDGLCDDLRRLGNVVHRTAQPAAADTDPVEGLSDDELALLVRLGRGLSLGAAAADLHLSRRTADRRLAEARRRLGARATAQAVALLRGS